MDGCTSIHLSIHAFVCPFIMGVWIYRGMGVRLDGGGGQMNGKVGGQLEEEMEGVEVD